MALIKTVRALVVPAVLAIAAPWVGAETIDCTPIPTMPAILAAPGVYCLTKDFDLNLSSGQALTVVASNVVLDLNGHSLGNNAAGPLTGASGVYANQRQNITIRNGTIRGFYIGIYLQDFSPYTTSQGHLIEDVRVDQNTLVGIWAAGRGMVIRDNQIAGTGGTLLWGLNVSGQALLVSGPSNRVIDNDVMTVTKLGTGTAWGVHFVQATDAFAAGNRITRADYGVHYESSTGKYRDNLTSSVSTPYLGGTNAGKNN